jgi:hypothetical protein
VIVKANIGILRAVCVIICSFSLALLQTIRDKA